MFTVTVGGGPTGTTAASNARSTALGMGCAALFLLPFAGFGVFAASLVVQRASQGNWREALYFLLFAVVFGGVGFGGLVGLLVGRRKVKEQEALKERHPKQPWLWQQDWALGRIDDATRGTLWLSWIFAAFWNLISFPLAFVAVRAALDEGNKAAFWALLFPLVGVGILVWAIRTTIRYQKYGISRLELSTVPGVIGHTIAGSIRVSTVLQPAEGFQATLSCVRRVTTRNGKNSSTTETILWQDERRVRGDATRDLAGLGTRVPVAFRLPSDARECDASNPNDRILWRLTLSASVPGVDYDSVFEVPVFRTEASERPRSRDEEQLTHDAQADISYRQPPDSRIAVTSGSRGTEIVFPAARNPAAAVGLTTFLLLWSGVLAFLIYAKAPIVFPVVFGLFELLLVFGALQLWLGVSHLTVDGRTLALATGYLYPGRERRIAASEIAEVTATIGMQAGTTPYYDVVILRKDGKKVTAGRSVRDKREAEWLAATIRSALGIRASRAATAA